VIRRLLPVAASPRRAWQRGQRRPPIWPPGAAPLARPGRPHL